MCFFSSKGLFVGIFLTFLGGLFRLFCSLPFVDASLSKDAQYVIALVGQVCAGMANPIAVSVSTKVSQNWFAGEQRTLATVFLTMSSPIGVMVSQGLTPVMVKEASDIATMNIVWAIPSFVCLISWAVFVRTSYPPTPPSRSADVGHKKLPYFARLELD